MNNLGSLLQDDGDYGGARLCYQRTLEIDEALHPKARHPRGHPDVAQSLNNLGIVYSAVGKLAKAESLLQRALAIRTENLGIDHPQVATTMDNLASLYDGQGQTAKAEPLYGRALAVRTETLGTDHPDVATSLNNLAYSYFQQRQYAKAEPLFLRALAIHEKALGPHHPDVATSLENLVELYRETGRTRLANKSRDRARKIRATRR